MRHWISNHIKSDDRNNKTSRARYDAYGVFGVVITAVLTDKARKHFTLNRQLPHVNLYQVNEASRPELFSWCFCGKSKSITWQLIQFVGKMFMFDHAVFFNTHWCLSRSYGNCIFIKILSWSITTFCWWARIDSKLFLTLYQLPPTI